MLILRLYGFLGLGFRASLEFDTTFVPIPSWTSSSPATEVGREQSIRQICLPMPLRPFSKSFRNSPKLTWRLINGSNPEVRRRLVWVFSLIACTVIHRDPLTNVLSRAKRGCAGQDVIV